MMRKRVKVTYMYVKERRKEGEGEQYLALHSLPTRSDVCSKLILVNIRKVVFFSGNESVKNSCNKSKVEIRCDWQITIKT